MDRQPCDFCNVLGAKEVFETRTVSVTRSAGLPIELFQDAANSGEWAACAACAALIHQNAKDALVVHASQISGIDLPKTYLHARFLGSFARFWAGRTEGTKQRIVLDAVCSPVQRTYLDLYRNSKEAPGENAGYRRVGSGVTFAAFFQRDALYFYDIRSEQRGKGHASALLRKLCAIADEHVSIVRLPVFAESIDGVAPSMNTEALKAWYQRYGFFEVGHSTGGHPLMERRPSAG